MAPKWSDEMNLKFVELYKEHRCLWDQRDDLYKDRNARETALVAIAENLNVQGFGVAEVKAKIKSFRGTFNIEMGKQKKSAKSGCGSADVYVPTLKWFNVMKEVMVQGTLTRHTKGTLMPGAACSTPTRTADDEDQAEPTSVDSNLEDANEQVDDPGNSTPIPEQSQKISNSPSDSPHQTTPDYQPKKKFKPRSKIQQIASTARELKNLSESVLRIDPGKDSEWDIYGRSVAAQLKCLSPAQALTAQMEINNALTKCRFNDLSGASTVPDRLLTLSTMCHPSNSSGSSHVFMTSPEPEEDMSQNVIISSTATPVTSVPNTFSQVFTALGYKHDG